MYARRQFSLFFIKNSWCCRLLIFFQINFNFVLQMLPRNSLYVCMHVVNFPFFS